MLGNSVQESEEIYKSVKSLYDVRSAFVHNGKHIDNENADIAHKITCSVLKKLYTINDEIDVIRSKLHQGGFGSKPYS